MMRWFIAAMLATLPVCGAAAQETRGSIEGTVSQSGSNAPVAGATITLFDSQGDVVASADTDPFGHFEFENLTAGKLLVTVSRMGYILPGAGQLHLLGAARVLPVDGQITLSPGEHFRNLHFELVAPSTISGTVFNPDGLPAANIRIQLGQIQFRNGQKIFTRAGQSTSSTMTNDRGEYRLFGVMPGTYFVAAEPPRTYTEPGDPGITTYFPSVVNPWNARPVDIASGQEAPHIDITLRTGLTNSVSVRVVPASPDISVTQVIAKLTPKDSNGPLGISMDCLIQSCYQNVPITIRNVPVGTYTLDIIRQGAESDSFGHADVLVQQNAPSDAIVELHNGVRVNFRTTFDVKPAGNIVQFALQWVDTVGSTAQRIRRVFPVTVEGNIGTGVIAGVVPGRYYIEPIQSAEFISDVRQGSTGVLNSGITIGSEPPEPISFTVGVADGAIRGIIENSKHLPVPFSRALLIPDAPARQDFGLYKNALADIQGRFSFMAVAPGNYKLFSWTSVADGMWTSEEFMQKYETSGTPVEVKPKAEVLDVHVTIIPAM